MTTESKYSDNTKEELCKMLEAYERVLDRKEERHTAEIAELLGKLETRTTLEVENLKSWLVESEKVIARMGRVHQAMKSRMTTKQLKFFDGKVID